VSLGIALMRWVGAALAPAGARSRLSTLVFHRVLDAPDPLGPGEVTADDFERIMRWVAGQFHVVPMRDAVAGLRTGRLPSRPLVVTFDDGYADNHDRAAPILARLGLPATFFIAAGYLDGGVMFNDVVAAGVAGCRSEELDLVDLGLGRHPMRTTADRRAALARLLTAIKPLPVDRRSELAAAVCERAAVPLPASPMMTAEQVAALKRAGFGIGAHTWSHPILARLDDAAARDEIQRGRVRLEEITGGAVLHFAYPNGRPGEDYTPRTVALVKELGFESAFTTTAGVATSGTDPHQLPRFTPWDRTQLRFGGRMLLNLLDRTPLTAEAAPGMGEAAAH
jgi:peptidoglycan/xylan/chitin deacetylase (PgdA/CDA1 family)